MTNGIFKEVEPGVVAHTAMSRVLAEDEAMNDWVGFCVEDMWPVSFLSLIYLTFVVLGVFGCGDRKFDVRLRSELENPDAR